LNNNLDEDGRLRIGLVSVHLVHLTDDDDDDTDDDDDDDDKCEDNDSFIPEEETAD